jgi:peptidoglycan DL-endopeptidase CwlO
MHHTKHRVQPTVRRQTALFASIMLVLGTIVSVPIVRADSFQDQINQIQADNSQKQQQVQALQVQADGYQAAIDALQTQINGIQAQIDANTAKSNDLQNQIVAAQAELDHQKKILGENIKAMYLQGDISTIEMLATSKDLSDYFDKQQYQDTVKNKIKATLDQVTALKSQLKDQQAQVLDLLQQQTNLRGQLSAQKAEQDNLLGLNESQRSAIDSQLKANFSRIADLRRQQAIANAQLGGAGIIPGDPGHGGYPAVWNNAAQDSLLDNWGMYNRECVSYTAWRVYETYGHMPYWGGQGNANQWPGDARNAGIPTGSTPRVNSVAIWNVGYYGHAMWVEAVNGDGSIWVSQYNYDYNGHYSEMKVSASMAAGLTYIYFN